MFSAGLSLNERRCKMAQCTSLQQATGAIWHGGHEMRTVVDQTAKALEHRLYYVALIAALTIPDMAAALESSDGRTDGTRYISWYEKWVRPRLLESRDRENPLTGKMCYGFRCGMLHQGRSAHDYHPYERIVFIEPGHQHFSLHYCTVGGKILVIQLDAFVREVLDGCLLWLKDVGCTEPFKTNYDNFARRHPDGLAPYIVGPSVVG